MHASTLWHHKSAERGKGGCFFWSTFLVVNKELSAFFLDPVDTATPCSSYGYVLLLFALKAGLFIFFFFGTIMHHNSAQWCMVV